MTKSFDAVSLQILWNRLISAVDEASAVLVRAAFSTVVRESHDFAIVVTDADGRLLAQATQAIPSFIGTLPRTVRFFIDRFGKDGIKPGDVLISNDPWFGTGHLPDVNLCRPIFFGGVLVGFAASTAHAVDIGGRSGSLVMRDIFEEGFQIPPIKIIAEGKVDETFVALMRQNVRAPDEVMGDIWAQITSLDVVSQRVGDLMAEYGLSELEALGREIHDRSEAAVRAAIAQIPQGTYRYTVTPDGLDEMISISIALTFDGESCIIDFEDAPAQLEGTSLNAVYAYTVAYTSYGLKCLLAPDLPNNDGVLRPIRIKAPEGSVLNHRFPVSGYSRQLIGHYLPVAAITAMAAALPDRVMAPCGVATWAFHQTGTNKDGKPYANMFFFNGGYGATSRHDGPSVLSWPSNISGVPVEFMERLGPFRVEHKVLRADSGGPGQYRGGLGLDIMFRITETSAINIYMQGDRTKSAPEGILGGQAGAAGEIFVNGVSLLPAKQAPLKTGDRLNLRTPGAGGYGPPASRAKELIERDLEEGYVTVEGAAHWLR